MADKNSVVTPERFAAGLTYGEYVAQVKVNADRFQEYYGTASLSAGDAEFFRRAAGGPDGASRVLVLAEAWCPDVFRGLPVIARIAEAAGMDLRVFPRDENLDIMNEFLNKGEFQSIPTVVFYTAAQRYLCHWIERPALANQERAQIDAELKRAMPDASEQDFRQAMRERTQARYPAWQQETVREIREMLARSLGM